MYRKILVPLDGSALAECVLPHVEAIARGCGVQDVIFLRAVEPYIPTDPEGVGFNYKLIEQIDAANKDAAVSYLAQLEGRIKYDGINIKTQVITGKAADSIAEYATKSAIDLIIVATHGRSGISRWVWGSVADRLLRSLCIPVLMVRAPGCVPGV